MSEFMAKEGCLLVENFPVREVSRCTITDLYRDHNVDYMYCNTAVH